MADDLLQTIIRHESTKFSFEKTKKNSRKHIVYIKFFYFSPRIIGKYIIFRQLHFIKIVCIYTYTPKLFLDPCCFCKYSHNNEGTLYGTSNYVPCGFLTVKTKILKLTRVHSSCHFNGKEDRQGCPSVKQDWSDVVLIGNDAFTPDNFYGGNNSVITNVDSCDLEMTHSILQTHHKNISFFCDDPISTLHTSHGISRGQRHSAAANSPQFLLSVCLQPLASASLFLHN